MQNINVKVYALALPMIVMAPAVTAEWYAGAGAGRTFIEIGAVNSLRSLELPDYFHPDPLLPISFVTSVDDEDEGYKVFTGIQFNRHFAAELGYARFGEVTAGYDLFQGKSTGELAGYYLALTGAIPLNELVSVSGKAGVHRWRLDDLYGVEVNFIGFGPNPPDGLPLGYMQQEVVDFSEDGSDLLYGAGLKIAWLEIFYETYEMHDNNVDFTGVSVSYGF